MRRIGTGGMGQIYEALDPRLQRSVALKLLHESGSPTHRQRLVREAQALARLEHPNVVTVFEVGQHEGVLFVVMELVRGGSLKDWIGDNPPGGAKRQAAAARLLADAARGLLAAHSAGLIHRDVKPSNILIGEDGRARVADFGIARSLRDTQESIDTSDAGGPHTHVVDSKSTTLTLPGTSVGTPAYMAPEQVDAGEVGEAADQFSFCVTVWETLLGQRPFEGQTKGQLRRAIQQGAVQVADSALIPNNLAQALRKGLRLRPTARHRSMEVLVAELEVLTDASDTATPRVPRRLWFGLGLATALVSVAGYEMTSRDTPSQRIGKATPAEEQPIASNRLVGSDHASVATSLEAPLSPKRARTTPAAPSVAESPDVRSLHAGDAFTCSLLTDDTIRCWGRQGPHECRPEQPGHIGDDELPHTVPALSFPGHRIEVLETEYFASHLCAILDDRTLRCWGDDRYGQLGNGPSKNHWCDTVGESLADLPVLQLPPAAEVHTHQYGTCALAGRDLLGVYCWGYNRFGQAGQGHRRQLDTPPSTPAELGEKPIVTMGMGIHTACALFGNGSLRCWGANHSAQLASGFPRDKYVGDGRGDGMRGQLPDSSNLNVRGLDDFEVALLRVNGGWNCAVSTEGLVRCWGGNHFGAVGVPYDLIPGCDPTTDGAGCYVHQPRHDVELGGGRVVDLQMGRLRACALDDAGAVRCWGLGEEGALGYGSALLDATGSTNIGLHSSPRTAYAQMGHDGVVDIGDFDGDGRIDKVVQIAMGYSHNCVLAEDGTVRCWGSNAEGELGYGNTDTVGDDETPAEYYAAHECGPVPVVEGTGCEQ